MLMFVALLSGLLLIGVGFTFATGAFRKNLTGNPCRAAAHPNRRFSNPALCPAIERLEPIILLATTEWKVNVVAGDFGDDTNWSMGAPGANDKADIHTGGVVNVTFANVEAAKIIEVNEINMVGTQVTFDLGQKTHSFDEIDTIGAGSSLKLQNGIISTANLANVIVYVDDATFTVEKHSAVRGSHEWESRGTTIISGRVNDHNDTGPLGRPFGNLYAFGPLVHLLGDGDLGAGASARFANVHIGERQGTPASVTVEDSGSLEVYSSLYVGISQGSFGKLTLKDKADSPANASFVIVEQEIIVGGSGVGGGEIVVQDNTSLTGKKSFLQYSSAMRSKTTVTGEHSSINVQHGFDLLGGDLLIQSGSLVQSATGGVYGTDSPKVTVSGNGSKWENSGDFSFGDVNFGGKVGEVLVKDGGIIESVNGKIKQFPNGKLLGNSTIKAGTQIVSQGNAAWILPGVGAGDMTTLTFDSDWDATGGVTYFVDIADAGGDLIHVTGDAALGGILNVTDAGATLVEDAEFTIVTAGSLGGAFDLRNSTLPELSPGLIWVGVYENNQAKLRIERLSVSGPDIVDEGELNSWLLESPDPNLLIDAWRVNFGNGEPVIDVAPDPDGYPVEVVYAYADGLANHTLTVTVVIDGEEYDVDTLDMTVNNVAPTIDSLVLDSYTINEDGSVMLTGEFTDPGAHLFLIDPYTGLPVLETEESFVVTINWGDGSAETVINLDNEERTFQATHQYLDDDPTGTSSDWYSIDVTVADDDDGVGFDSTSVTVDNVDPVVTLNVDASINENDTVTATGSVTDVGTLDTFTSIDIDWGDGTYETVMLEPDGTYSIDHTYVDDDISGTASDDYYVYLSATDDDTGYGEAWTMVTVLNVNPVITLDPVSDVDEGGDATLTGTITDIGPADTHELTIDWGDGYVDYFTVTVGAFSFSHTYEDDDPTDTASDNYTIAATVEDDDTGSDAETAAVTVNNLPPVIVLDSASGADEWNSAYVSGTVTDPGVYDTHTVTIDWGDGQSESAFVDSFGSFDAYHYYADDDPTGTASDVYTISATAEDDDTGHDVDTAQITVTNVAPTLYYSDYYYQIENGIELTVEGEFEDVWNDSHTLTIDWGDGSSDALSYDAGGSGSGSGGGEYRSFNLTHTYTDPNPDPDWEVNYSYTITVEDDDLGETTDTGSGSAWGSGSGSGGSSGSSSGGGSGSSSGGGSALIYEEPSTSDFSESNRLRIRDVVPLYQEAVRRWDALTDDPLIERSLREVVVRIANLPDGQLGFAVNHTIVVDLNANGLGWFVDPTPSDEAEFLERRDGEFHAHARSEAFGRIDVLTVLMHEMGHILGLDHTEGRFSGLMHESLSTGVRRVPDTVPTFAWIPHPTTGESVIPNVSDPPPLGRIVNATPNLVQSITHPSPWLESETAPVFNGPPKTAIHRSFDEVFASELEQDNLLLFE